MFRIKKWAKVQIDQTEMKIMGSVLFVSLFSILFACLFVFLKKNCFRTGRIESTTSIPNEMTVILIILTL